MVGYWVEGLAEELEKRLDKDDHLLAFAQDLPKRINKAVWAALRIGSLATLADAQHLMERAAVAGGATLDGAAKGGRTNAGGKISLRRRMHQRWAAWDKELADKHPKLKQSERIIRIARLHASEFKEKAPPSETIRSALHRLRKKPVA